MQNSSIWGIGALLLGISSFLSCQSSVYTGDRDLTELESVWQYLKVYSIYYDSITDDPFEFNTPEELMLSVHDTLHSVSYTKYAFNNNRSSTYASYSASYPDTVVVNALSDSTVCMTITEFGQDIYQKFASKLPAVASYKKVIIDLQNNGGGDLNQLDSILEAFLPSGTQYIKARSREYDATSRTARTVPSDSGWEIWTAKRATAPQLTNKQIAVVINGGTASASEILAAALRDGLGAPLVGSTSYGKGIGQIKIPRRNRDTLQITFLKLRGLSDRIGDYHHHGIVPDTVSPSVRAWASTYTSGNDAYTYNILCALKVLEPSLQNPSVLHKATGLVQSNLSTTGAYITSPPDPLDGTAY